MRECGSFDISFSNLDEAKAAAKTIKEWALANLKVNGWVEQLDNIDSNRLFVGNSAAMDWYEYDEKTRNIAKVIHEAHPSFVFSGEQEFMNLTTGFKVDDLISCDGTKVEINQVEKCENCGQVVQGEGYTIDIFEDYVFCDEACAKEYLINALLDEDDFDEDELAEKEVEELAEMYEEY